MNINQFLSLAPTLYKNGISVHLVSRPGQGKSDVITNDVPRVLKQALAIEQFDTKLANLTSYDAPDVRGFAIPVKDERTGNMVTRFTESPLMPSDDMAENGIVFLDEFPQAGPDVQKPSADFKLNGRAGESQLPPGWRVWSAGNRLEDMSGVNKILGHITNRHCIIELDFHIDPWCNWAFKNGIDPLFIAFAKFKPGALTEEVPRDGSQYCTPRSYANAAELCKEYTGDNINEALCDDPLILELMTGTIGKSAAVQAMAFMKVAADLPSMQEIIDTPDVAAKKIPRDRLDVVHSATALVVHNVDHESIDPIFQFTENLPKEFQTATIKQMLDKLGGTAINHPRFAKWMTENKALVASSFA